MLDTETLLELWHDMWKEGNWIPSWPDSLNGVTAEMAAWKPQGFTMCRSIWEEAVHVAFWREVTLRRMAGLEPPDEDEIERSEFAVPADTSEASWRDTVTRLRDSHYRLAEALEEGTADISRVHQHLIHDAYHLGRITLVRRALGSVPAFLIE